MTSAATAGDATDGDGDGDDDVPHAHPSRLLRASIGGENRSWDVCAGRGGSVLFAAVVKGRVKVYVGGAAGSQICELWLRDDASKICCIFC